MAGISTHDADVDMIFHACPFVISTQPGPFEARTVAFLVIRRARYRLDRLAAGWFLVALVYTLSQPTAVRAGCDALHDLSTSGGAPGAPRHLVLLERYGALEGVTPEMPSPFQPCSGPSCSRGPKAPDVPLQLGGTVGVERWPCLALPGQSVRPIAFQRRNRDDRVKPVTGGPSVFHPPPPSALA